VSFWSGIERRLQRLAGHVESDAELRQMAEHGERLEQAAKSAGWELIWNEIFIPLRDDAQKKLQEVDPSDFSAVAQYQKIAAIVESIPQIIEHKVQAGRNATNLLSAQETLPLKEGE